MPLLPKKRSPPRHLTKRFSWVHTTLGNIAGEVNNGGRELFVRYSKPSRRADFKAIIWLFGLRM